MRGKDADGLDMGELGAAHRSLSLDGNAEYNSLLDCLSGKVRSLPTASILRREKVSREKSVWSPGSLTLLTAVGICFPRSAQRRQAVRFRSPALQCAQRLGQEQGLSAFTRGWQ